jgi:hypothetical protein
MLKVNSKVASTLVQLLPAIFLFVNYNAINELDATLFGIEKTGRWRKTIGLRVF